eukprot:TRINITY_DN30500_c0_g1_i1.p1 TRINITY_DN30500_c0_g1~~TRINITY_DN30500_c0_g1_i1.p1  ORF type:complete len:152 (+),score=31.45 TRINITY_DN30500_c0_g1_i1:53-508(+)
MRAPWRCWAVALAAVILHESVLATRLRSANASAANTASNSTAASVTLPGVGALVLQNATAMANASANATGSTFKESCQAACDACFTIVPTPSSCYAKCYKGKQRYCTDICIGDCEPMWTATPGLGDGLTRKFCGGMKDVDGCPTQPYSYDG